MHGDRSGNDYEVKTTHLIGFLLNHLVTNNSAIFLNSIAVQVLLAVKVLAMKASLVNDFPARPPYVLAVSM